MAREPSSELLLVLDLNEVHGVLFVDLGQAERVRAGRIHSIDPIDEGQPIPKDRCGSIEHDLSTGIVLLRSRTRSRPCRARMVFEDQPTERVAPLDRIWSR